MSPALPTELLELIVECIEDDGSSNQDLISLCSAARGFVDCCQRRVFYKISLHHPVSMPRPEVPQELLSGYRRTISFAEAVSRRPDLALHVKILDYWLPSDVMQESDIFFPVVIRALNNMKNVSSLRLGFDDRLPVPSYLAMRSRAWQRAVRSLLQRPALTRLALCNVLSFPFDALLKAVQLETFEAFNTYLESLCALPATTLQLKILKYEGPVPILSAPNENHTSLLGIPNLVELDVHVGTSGDLDRQGIRLLRACKTLRSLKLTHIEFNNRFNMESPLDELNPDSFSTLTHLTMNMITNISHRKAPINHPYRSLPSSSVLPRLKRLESLVLNIFFQGCLFVHPSTFGPYLTWEQLSVLADDWVDLPWRLLDVSLPHWTGIYDIVSNRSCLPALKTFRVNLHLRSPLASKVPELQPAIADEFVNAFEALVKPVMLRHTDDIRARDIPIDFGLTIDKSVGPQLLRAP